MKFRTSLFTLSIVASFGMLIALAFIRAQDVTGQSGVTENTGFPEDWSHRHIVFANPGTEEDAIQNGRYDEWVRIVNDPRYVMQQRLRNSGGRPLMDGAEVMSEDFNPAPSISFPEKKKNKLSKDWSEGVGAGAPYPSSSGGVPIFPLKWNFSTSTASCAADYVIFPTAVAGSSSKATLVAYYELYSSCTGSPTVSWAYNTAFAPVSAGGAANSAAVLTSPTFSTTGSQIAFVQIAASKAYLVILKVQQTPPGTGTLTNPTT